MERKLILCVDDSRFMRHLVTDVLEDYEVISVDTKADALQQTAKGRFSLYLIDNNLPDGSGLELARLIRDFDAETPILIVSGAGSIKQDELRKISINGFIMKSDRFVDELSEKVHALLK